MTPKAQVEYRNIAELHELPGNPRTIKKDQFEKLKKSLTDNADYFEARPIILSDRTGQLVILAGNQRYKAAKALGLQQVPTITLHDLTEDREREIIIRDNVNNGEWDMDALANEWDSGQLLDWGVEIPKMESITEIIEDTPPEVSEAETMTKLGDIYQLGDHRLMVGDSTKAEDVRKLMDGQLADLLVTDPPYNVNYSSKDGKKIQNDNMGDDSFREFLTDAMTAATENMRAGAAFYIWHADSEGFNFRYAIKSTGLQLRQTLIWVKNSLVLGRQDYQWQHEPCLYGWKDGASHYFIDDRKQTTVLNFEKPRKSEAHPTMKPVKLIARLVANSSREHEKVLDIFGGSGTTMIACEQLNRSCYMMELDPHYADVIIKRWENLTGKKAEKVAG